MGQWATYHAVSLMRQCLGLRLSLCYLGRECRGRVVVVFIWSVGVLRRSPAEAGLRMREVPRSSFGASRMDHHQLTSITFLLLSTSRNQESQNSFF